jgi:hypothetical protein
MANDQTLFVAPQNTYDLHAEWGPSFQDRRNVFVANSVYELPTFSGRNTFIRETLGGFEISGILLLESGQWGSVTQTTADPAAQGILAANSPASARLDQIANPNTGAPRNVAKFFNTAAFAQVPTGVSRPGDEKRNSVEGPGEENVTLDLFRNFSLPHEMRFQFRVEAFNLLNHVNFMTVNTAFNNAAYGTVTAANNNRQMQIAAKLYY